MIAEIDLAKEPTRAKFLPRGYLYETASDFEHKAERLERDANDADETQAQLMRRAAERLREMARRFDQQADATPSEDDDLPFK